MTQTHLTEAQLAQRWNLSRRTLQRWRRLGAGPAFIRLGRRIIYALDDIMSFEVIGRTLPVHAASDGMES